MKFIEHDILRIPFDKGFHQAYALVLEGETHAIKHGIPVDNPHAAKPSHDIAEVLDLHLSCASIRILFLGCTANFSGYNQRWIEVEV